MKMRLESLVHAARQRYGTWAAIFILFAALCTLSVFSARDAREAAADPVRAETSSQCCGECLKGQKISFLIDCIL